MFHPQRCAVQSHAMLFGGRGSRDGYEDEGYARVKRYFLIRVRVYLVQLTKKGEATPISRCA